MNEQNNPDEIADLLSNLSRLEPSLSGRMENRRVIAEQLAQLSRQHHRPEPWWRRRISVPWPLAIAASLLLMYGATLINGPNVSSNDRAKQAANNPKLQTVPSGDSEEETRQEQTLAERPSFEIKQTYLCGVGRLNTHSFYAIEEN